VASRKRRDRPHKRKKTEKPFRPLGLYRGKIRIDPSFFDPLPDDIIAAFEGRLNPEEDPLQNPSRFLRPK
jgi:hypothetical protein